MAEDTNQSPREFLRRRRPERFSDSEASDQNILGQSELAYHLETLTNRKQEGDFEVFARKLAERTICPNLVPQTGPTGGGDSKVDTETFPVASAFALTWYGGDPAAAAERWAFAFSAKKDWRPKLKSDIEKIAATGRGYTRAFFVTNQFVPDRQRSALQDALTTTHGLQVTILDRTWILEQVYTRGLVDIAIDSLRIPVETKQVTRTGPRDSKRKAELTAIEGKLAAAPSSGALGSEVVDLALRAAVLGRELERPRVEIDGLFLRVMRLAVAHGTAAQRFEAMYQEAWTAFWWHEDYSRVLEIYALLEAAAVGSDNAVDFERLTSLWMALHSASARGRMDPAALSAHTSVLLNETARLAADVDRPSVALRARTERALVNLLLAGSASDADAILNELTEVIQESAGLVNYPMKDLVELVSEVGPAFEGSEAYDRLFESVVAESAARNGEIAAARLLVDRGAAQLDRDLPYEAIKTLGRALRRLYRNESRADLIRALYLCGRAYTAAGLPWAARGCCCFAASIATDEFWMYSDITRRQCLCYGRLRWIELEIGRLPEILSWYEVFRGTAGVLAARDEIELSAEEERRFDVILGIRFLRAPLSTLSQLTQLPDVLELLDLPLARNALLFALGHTDALDVELLEEAGGAERLTAFFELWRDQPASAQLGRLEAANGQEVRMDSHVLGCALRLTADNDRVCVGLGEWLLAAVEAFLSTSLTAGAVAVEAEVNIRVASSEYATAPFSYEVGTEEGRPYLHVFCKRAAIDSLTRADNQLFAEHLTDLLAEVVGRIVFIRDVEGLLSALVTDELAFERAISFSGGFPALTNVLGFEARRTTADWCRQADRHYPLLRTRMWDKGDGAESSRLTAPDSPSRPRRAQNDAPVPDELRDLSATPHSAFQTIGLIRPVLWDAANWRGTAFLTDAADTEPPALGLIFENPASAEELFRLLQRDVHTDDIADALRITVIRGIDQTNPQHYRIVVTPNIDALALTPTRRVMLISRSNAMTPRTTENLDRFLASFAKHGLYGLLPCAMSRSGPVPHPDLSIIKHAIHVREAWEIGQHDPDSQGIRASDDPVVPAGVNDPPVAAVLAHARSRQE